jgi:hypothetical protein
VEEAKINDLKINGSLSMEKRGNALKDQGKRNSSKIGLSSFEFRRV